MTPLAHVSPSLFYLPSLFRLCSLHHHRQLLSRCNNITPLMSCIMPATTTSCHVLIVTLPAVTRYTVIHRRCLLLPSILTNSFLGYSSVLIVVSFLASLYLLSFRFSSTFIITVQCFITSIPCFLRCVTFFHSVLSFALLGLFITFFQFFIPFSSRVYNVSFFSYNLAITFQYTLFNVSRISCVSPSISSSNSTIYSIYYEMQTSSIPRYLLPVMSDRFRSLSDLPTSPNFSHPPSYYIQRLLRQRRSTEDKSQLVLLHRTHSKGARPGVHR